MIDAVKKISCFVFAAAILTSILFAGGTVAASDGLDRDTDGATIAPCERNAGEIGFELHN